MTVTKIGKIAGGQDGAIYESLLFRLTHAGECFVYDLTALVGVGEETPLATFTLGMADKLTPHSNAVFFGSERYAPEDEFPILYSNIYNNRASFEDKMLGTLLAYRILRCDGGFSATPVQLIRIGFCEDPALWRARPEAHGVRPYGNFVLDRERGELFAFVMRDEARGTRYFRLPMPPVHAGEAEPLLGVRQVTLSSTEILAMLDMPFYRYIQGATAHRSLIYSTEGFSHSTENPPAIRVVDPLRGSEVYGSLPALGIYEEPEMIDFFGEVCYYSDCAGNLYTVSFDGEEV